MCSLINSIFYKMTKNKVAHRKQTSVTSESSSKEPDEGRQCYVSLFVKKYLEVYKTEDAASNNVS